MSGTTENKINDLEGVLKPLLHDTTLQDYQVKRLTSAGDNYGSLMLQVDVKLKTPKDSEEVLHLVAKMVPPNDWLQQMFNTAETFKREIEIYRTIIPTLQNFQKEQGVSRVISCFPKMYGCRFSLDPKSDSIDDDAILLLENLKASQFETVERTEGFDYQTTKLIVKDLAAFHAVPVAIKLLKPEIFKKHLMPHLKKVKMFEFTEEVRKTVVETIIKQAEESDPATKPHLASAEKTILKGVKELSDPNTVPAEPYATINHNDLWVNNTMVRFENGKPVDNKILDFQVISYGSPANDVIFFLFSSVQKEVLDEHYDDFMKLYHETFIATLKEVKCDTSAFTFELFQQEVLNSITLQFAHVMLMLKPIYAPRGVVRDITEITMDDLMSPESISEKYKQKVPEKILEFANRKWI